MKSAQGLPYSVTDFLKIALEKLDADDLSAAFQFADQACRANALPNENGLLVRATLLSKRGYLTDAVNDLKTASLIMHGNHNIALSLLRLCWSDLDNHQKIFNQSLVSLLRQVPKISLNPEVTTWIAGSGLSAIGAAWREDEFVTGWAINTNDPTAGLLIELDGNFFPVETGMPTPWLIAAGIGNGYNGFRLKLPASFGLLRIGISGSSLWGCPFLGDTKPAIPELPLQISNAVDIIVPVYSGADETLACLDSINASNNNVPYRVIVIDDYSPDMSLRNALRERAHRKEIILLSRPINAGFSGAVNTGLAFDTSRDVILLNADTLVFGNWLDRLRATAYQSDDIATVTPLSNHGELVSYPLPMYNNPVLSVEHAQSVDELFNSIGPKQAIELPAGVGFCFFIKRQALNQVGLLDEGTFGRGYGEDTDFCLRIQQAGWRNVCAANTYVVHWGSRSFGAEKQHLVAQNLHRLSARYPTHSAEYDQFLDDDPLYELRRNAQRQWLAKVVPQYKGTVYLTAKLSMFPFTLDCMDARVRATHGAVAESLSKGEQKHPKPTVKPLMVRQAHHERLNLMAATLYLGAENPEQAITFSLTPIEKQPGHWQVMLNITGITGLDSIAYDWPSQSLELREDIRAAGFIALELKTLGDWPAEIIDQLTDGFISYNLSLEDYSGYCPRKYRLIQNATVCDDPDNSICSNCIAELGPLVYGYTSIEQWQDRSLRILSKANKISVLNDDIRKAYIRRFPMLSKQITINKATLQSPPTISFPTGTETPLRIAVLSARSLDEGYLQLIEQATKALKQKPTTEFMVLGATLNDVNLQRLANIHLTGHVAQTEIRAVLRLHNCSAIANFSPCAHIQSRVAKIAQQFNLPLIHAA